MRTNLILAGLAGVLAIPTTVSIYRDIDAFTTIDEIPQLFPGFTQDYVTQIRISKMKVPEGGEQKPVVDPANSEQAARDEIVFVKQDGAWLVGKGDLAGVPVLGYRMTDDILSHIHGVRRDNVIRPNADDDYLEKADLTEAKGILIECADEQGNGLASLFLGASTSGDKYGAEFIRGYFVRRSDTKSVVVYEPPAPGYWTIGMDPGDWVDRKMHEFEADKVKRFMLRNKKGAATFEKKDGAWVVAESSFKAGAVRKSELEGLISRFSFMSTEGYQKPLQQYGPGQLAQYGLSSAKYEIAATSEDDKTYRLSIGNKLADKNEYHAVFSESDFLNRVGDWVVSDFERDPKELTDPHPEEVGGSKSPEAKKADGAGEAAAPVKKADGTGEVAAPVKKADGAGEAAAPVKKPDGAVEAAAPVKKPDGAGEAAAPVKKPGGAGEAASAG